jgi:hypothetical protein
MWLSKGHTFEVKILIVETFYIPYNLAIITYFDFLNESKFLRSDRIKFFWDNVMTSFPKGWKEKVE